MSDSGTSMSDSGTSAKDSETFAGESDFPAELFPAEPRRYSLGQQPWRLVVLAYLAGYFYLLYWFYRNWRDLRDQIGLQVRPWLRTAGLLVPLLNFYLIYDQFKEIRDADQTAGQRPVFLFVATTGFLTFSNLTTLLPNFIWPSLFDRLNAVLFILLIVTTAVSWLLACLSLVLVQRGLNRLWEKVHGKRQLKNYFSSGEKALIGTFGSIFVLGLLVAVGQASKMVLY
ncbi:MAG: hypothetical protein M1455_11210 [Actinobacteria bacterium]|nr:hypothetical protein [Actinomycetota bacterium]